MTIAVECPECQDRYEVPDQAADQLIRCRRCQCPIDAKRREPQSEGIQTNPTPVLGSPSRQRQHDDNAEPERPRRHPKPRSPFPWTALLIVVIGVLFFLLAFSVGFNVWFLVNPDKLLHMEERARRAEQEAMQQRLQAEQAAQMALANEKRARENLAKAQADVAAEIKLREEADRLPWGSLEGRVVWKGDLPKVESLETTIRKHPDAKLILAAPKELLLDPTWRIDPKTKGLANVVVFLKRPAGGKLPIHPDDKVRNEPVVIEAPDCIFVPHVAAVYPEWFDGDKRGATGQKLISRNSTRVLQNRHLKGDPLINAEFNAAIQPLVGEQKYDVKAQLLPLMMKSQMHFWMQAYVFAFDHPYYAISKEDGTFTIPRVPAAMEVQVMAWHEAQGWLFTRDGKTMTLKKGKNTLDFEMSAK
jgi:hypothetical protein